MTRHHHFMFPAALVVAASVTLAACSSGTKTTPAASGGATSSGPTTGQTATPAPGGVKAIGKSVTFGGFKVTVDTAALAPAPSGGDSANMLTLDATFENQGADNSTFSGQLSVTSHGADFPAGDGGALPSIPGGGKNKGTVMFPVDAQFTLADATVTFGGPEETQAKIPLGSAGSLVALDPIPLTGLVAATAAGFKFDPQSGVARPDQIAEHKQAAKGHWYVYIKVKAAYSAGSTRLDPGYVTLTLPDGTSVVAEPAGDNNEILTQVGGDSAFRFLVADPPTGTYTGIVTLHTLGGLLTSSNFSLTVPRQP